MPNSFIKGSISSGFIAETISNLSTNTSIGAYDIFLGQIRADKINDKEVIAIDYSAHETMAMNNFNQIIEDTLLKFELIDAQIHHSLGKVFKGEICLFVIVAAGHRKTVFKAIEYIVERIKKEAPIYGKELFEDKTHVWKVNQ